MHPLELIILILASLGSLFGIAILTRELIESKLSAMKKILRSPTTWFTITTLFFSLMAYLIHNFFYDFWEIAFIVGALTVLTLSGKLMRRSVCYKAWWLSIPFALFWGTWSSPIYLLYALNVAPDHLKHSRADYSGLIWLGIIIYMFIISAIVNFVIGLVETSKRRKQEKQQVQDNDQNLELREEAEG